MRRIVAAVLFLAFLAQSSGVAFADTGDLRKSGLSFDVASIVAPIRTAAVQSQAWAAFTGNSDRYAAIHAPAPHFVKRDHPDAAGFDVSHKRLAKPYLLQGIRELSQIRFERPPDFHHPPALPQSMRSYHGSAGRGRGGRMHAFHQLRPNSTVGRTAYSTNDTGTGYMPWWTYATRPIPGVGGALFNVGTGNLMIQASDLEIPERGIPLTFQRTYNSQSWHDANADDGSEPAIFGNGWTNEWDMHVVMHPGACSSSSPTVYSVYDATGARWDYTVDCHGIFHAPPGQQAVLEASQADPMCAVWWVQPSGDAFYFRSPDPAVTASCNIAPGNVGRLSEVVGLG